MPSAHSTLPTRRFHLARPLALGIALAWLSGCTAISARPATDDWPMLKIVENRLDMWPLLSQCYAATPLWLKLLGGITVACTTVNLADMTCTMYVHTDAGPGDPNYEHELAHCTGQDHIMDATLASLWANWKRAKTADGADYIYVRNDGQRVTLKGKVLVQAASSSLR